METPIKTYFIRTYGCQMNELDSELMVGMLEAKGLSPALTEDEADLLIFNTCSIRDLSERKVMGKIGKYKKRKKNKPLIGVTGCMANAKKDSLFEKLPHIDFVLGTNNIADLGDVVEQVAAKTGRPLRVDDTFNENLDYLVAKRDDPVKAFVSIIRGCNNHCTYCVVPYTRGTEVSRPLQSILDECKHLANQGYKEITLLGQNVNSYGKDQPEWNLLFHDLLYEIDKIEGIERIRFMTSHPVDITIDLMHAIHDLPKVCEFVHFPMQAGSDRILRKMHRIYTKNEYIEKVQRLRAIVPNATLGTDIITGFPTETDAEFEETYDLFKEIGYTTAFIFAYSRRKGTPAHRWSDDIPEEVKQERLQRLLTLHNENTAKQLKQYVGQNLEVLVEKAYPENNLLMGRTRGWTKVLFPGATNLIGTLQNVTISSTHHQTLVGQ